MSQPGADGDGSAPGHGIHGIEDEIGEGFTELGFDREHRRQVLMEIRVHHDDLAAQQRHVLPPRARQGLDLLDHRVQIDRTERQRRFPAA